MSICARVEPARGGALGKRKEPECSSSPSSFPGMPAKPEPRKPALPASRLGRPLMPPPPPPPPECRSGKLLAGYLAHEFLMFGTLLGERRAAASRKGPAAAEPEHGRRYAEASWVLTAGGARIPGVVNPTQLGCWLRIKQ